MRVKSTISQLDAEIAKLQQRRQNLISKASERFARAAAKAGLAELEISDAELDKIFGEIAARFPKSAPKTAGAA